MEKMYHWVKYDNLSLEELIKILQKMQYIDSYVADVKEVGRNISEDGTYYIKLESSCELSRFWRFDNEILESLVSDLKTVVQSIEFDEES